MYMSGYTYYFAKKGACGRPQKYSDVAIETAGFIRLLDKHFMITSCNSRINML